MPGTSPFLLRRVLLGVLIGLTLLAVGFFGWVQFRTSEYRDREAQVLSHYRNGYAACLRQQTEATTCARRLRELCTRDGFWQDGPPFLIDLAPQLSTPDVRCRDEVPG